MKQVSIQMLGLVFFTPSPAMPHSFLSSQNLSIPFYPLHCTALTRPHLSYYPVCHLVHVSPVILYTPISCPVLHVLLFVALFQPTLSHTLLNIAMIKAICNSSPFLSPFQILLLLDVLQQLGGIQFIIGLSCL